MDNQSSKSFALTRASFDNGYQTMAGKLQVAKAGFAVETALRKAYEPLQNSEDVAKNKAVIKYDSLNVAVWIKAVRGSQVG